MLTGLGHKALLCVGSVLLTLMLSGRGGSESSPDIEAIEGSVISNP